MPVDDLTRAMLESSNDCWSLVKIFSSNLFRMRLGPNLNSPMYPAPLSLGIKNVRHECNCEFQRLVDVRLGKEQLHAKYKIASLSFKFQKISSFKPSGHSREGKYEIPQNLSLHPIKPKIKKY